MTSGAWTDYPSRAPEFTPGFSVVCVNRSLVLCECFLDRCLSYFWPLCCLFFIDLRILINPLESSTKLTKLENAMSFYDELKCYIEN
jgi:hypothetical protein